MFMWVLWLVFLLQVTSIFLCVPLPSCVTLVCPCVILNYWFHKYGVWSHSVLHASKIGLPALLMDLNRSSHGPLVFLQPPTWSALLSPLNLPTLQLHHTTHGLILCTCGWVFQRALKLDHSESSMLFPSPPPHSTSSSQWTWGSQLSDVV